MGEDHNETEKPSELAGLREVFQQDRDRQEGAVHDWLDEKVEALVDQWRKELPKPDQERLSELEWAVNDGDKDRIDGKPLEERPPSVQLDELKQRLRSDLEGIVNAVIESWLSSKRESNPLRKFLEQHPAS
jgi:hypothetical protein